MEEQAKVKSAILLMEDVQHIQSYDTLIELSVAKLVEDGSLDILVLPRIKRLNVLDQILAAIYTLSTDILQRLNMPHINVTVLFNDHYKDIKDPTWEVLILDSSSDKSYDQFEFVDKDSLLLIDVHRSVAETVRIGLIHDDSQEAVHEVGAVGGTFDHFHDGHKILLTAAAFVTKTKLIVGVTDQELLAKKQYKEFLQSYDFRVHSVVNFLKHITPELIVETTAIRDVCGPTGYIEAIDSLIVSRESVAGGAYVNKKRVEKGFHELTIHVINVIGGEEDDGFQSKLSSTQLRKEQHELLHKDSANTNETTCCV